MGTIYYGGDASAIDIEDRALAHLKVVIATKLRRGESFTLTWRHPDDQPRGRSTVWLSPSIPLRFVFDDPEPAVLSREWMEELAQSANSSGGIMLVAEHFDVDPSENETTIEVGAIVAKDVDVENATVGSIRQKASSKSRAKSQVDVGD